MPRLSPVFPERATRLETAVWVPKREERWPGDCFVQSDWSVISTAQRQLRAACLYIWLRVLRVLRVLPVCTLHLRCTLHAARTSAAPICAGKKRMPDIKQCAKKNGRSATRAQKKKDRVQEPAVEPPSSRRATQRPRNSPRNFPRLLPEHTGRLAARALVCGGRSYVEGT